LHGNTTLGGIFSLRLNYNTTAQGIRKFISLDRLRFLMHRCALIEMMTINRFPWQNQALERSNRSEKILPCRQANGFR
jgi:hypothetical protein